MRGDGKEELVLWWQATQAGSVVGAISEAKLERHSPDCYAAMLPHCGAQTIVHFASRANGAPE